MAKAPGFCPCSDHIHWWNATWCYLYDRPIHCPHEPGTCPNRREERMAPLQPAPVRVTGTGWPGGTR
jgi:hypothetical protein